MCTAIAVLDAVRDSGQVPPERFGEVVARISFFVNAGVRFVEEMCKMRAFVQLWDELTLERYGVTDQAQRRFRYGVQVNSLGLTEAQPENNVQRIVLEMLGRDHVQGRPGPGGAAAGVERGARPARGRGTSSGPCGCSRCSPTSPTSSSTTTCSRAPPSSQAKVAELVDGARAEIDRVQAMGGAVAAVESGYIKSALVASHARRRQRIEAGEDIVVGRQPVRVDRAEPAHRAGLGDGDPDRRPRGRGRCGGRRPGVAGTTRRGPGIPGPRRCGARPTARRRRSPRANLMPASLECARAGVTTGEWAQALRDVFGEYRAPTGVGGAMLGTAAPSESLAAVRDAVARTSRELGETGFGSSSASPVSMGTPTVPSRSPCGRATPASRSSTRASG